MYELFVVKTRSCELWRHLRSPTATGNFDHDEYRKLFCPNVCRVDNSQEKQLSMVMTKLFIKTVLEINPENDII